MTMGGNYIDINFWAGRRAVITGHMGFKGAWLSQLLSVLGVQTIGYGKDDRRKLLYRELAIAGHAHHEGDIQDIEKLSTLLRASAAEVLFHMAAQPIVLSSYQDPVGTFEDNVMGAIRILQAARSAPSLKAIVIVTSDKVYKNNNWIWGYRETDSLGGHDPYSASKAACEIVTASMAASFFNTPDMPAVATARAGNVIGGGDWADFRLLPDAARALAARRPLMVRNPESTRPWQHVLDPLFGYVMLAQALATSTDRQFSCWNFGPALEDALPVRTIADFFVREWGGAAEWQIERSAGSPPPKEASMLAVDSTKARAVLGWSPRWRVSEAVAKTSSWYRNYFQGADPNLLVQRDIEAYLDHNGMS